MTELKTCPFCGAEYEKDEDDFWYAADHTEDCFFTKTAAPYGRYPIFLESEIELWNRRVNNG